MPPIKAGYLTKQGGASNSNAILKSLSAMSWKKRYFEFDGTKLTYFGDGAEKGKLDMSKGYSVLASPSDKAKQENQFEIITEAGAFVVAAPTKQEMQEWIDALNSHPHLPLAAEDKSDDEMEEALLKVNMKLIAQNCEMKGKLNKLGSKLTRLKQWRRRWFFLHDRKLYYLKSLEDLHPLGVVDLAQCSEVRSADEELSSQNTFVITVPGRSYYCQAETSQELEMWLSTIERTLKDLLEEHLRPFTRKLSAALEAQPLNIPPPSELPSSPSSDFDSSEEKKNEAVLNAYLKMLKSFDEDDAMEDDDSDIEGDQPEELPEPLPPSQPTSAPKPITPSQPLDDSTKNAINTLFRLNSMASKIMKYFGKLIGSDYLVSVLGTSITDLCTRDESMEVDPQKVTEGEDAEANKLKLVGVCQKILTSILQSKKTMPVDLASICKHLYIEVEKRFPGNGPRQVGGFLFLRFFCPAIVQPNAHGVVSPDFQISDNVKRSLLLITKVLQNLSNGVMFGTKELYMGGPLNDFISQNIEPLNDFFRSFSSMDSLYITPPSAFSTSTSELSSATTLIASNLKFAFQLDDTLPAKFEPSKLDQLKELFESDDLKIPAGQVVEAVGGDLNIASAVCSTMKVNQLDGLAEALVIVYGLNNRISQLLEWVITDEVSGTGLSSKKFEIPASTDGNVKPVKILRSGYLMKLGGNFKNWRKRWFVLTEDALTYYKNRDETIPIQTIEMRICSSIRYHDDAEFAFCFEIATPGRTFKFAAETEPDRIQWIEAIKPFIEKGLLASLMKARKTSSLGAKRSTIFVSGSGSPIPGSPISNLSPSASMTSFDDQPNLTHRTRGNVDRAMATLSKEGWLVKKGGNFKTWKRRWFILKNGYLVYYKDQSKNELMGIVDLEELNRVESVEAKLHLSKCFEVGTGSRVYFLIASSDQEMKAWIDILKQILYYFKPSLAPPPEVASPKEASGSRRVLLEGWLAKQGGSNKSWKNRWFVLSETTLNYFENSADSLQETLAKGSISLDEAYIQIIEDHKFSFCFAVGTTNRIYFLLAKDRADLEKWTNTIENQIPVYRLEQSETQQKQQHVISKYHAAVMEKWNVVTNPKPTVRVGAREISQNGVSGFLMKASKALTDKSNSPTNWQKRFFVLHNYCLYYFKSPLDQEALGTIELGNIEVEKFSDNAEACALLNNMKGNRFWQRGDGFGQEEKVYAQSIANKIGFVIKGRTKKYFLLAETEPSNKEWITSIKEASKGWGALLEHAGVTKEKMNDANTAKIVQTFIQTDVRMRTTSAHLLAKEVRNEISADLTKALTSSQAQNPGPAFVYDDSDDSSGDER